MKLGAIAHALGALLVFMAAAGLAPLAVDLVAEAPAWPWLVMVGVTAGLGGFAWWWGARQQQAMGLREGIAITSLTWLVSSLAGALGLMLASPAGFIASWFECMSGFTTTGATVFGGTGPEDPWAIVSQTPGVLLWRSLMQWMGGIGIVVISLALLPLLVSGSGFQLYRAEVPGIATDRLAPRIRDTARILLGLYVGLTLIITAALLAVGCGFFESACHALTTVATGGFSPYDNSVEGLQSATAEWIIIVGMLAGGFNFGLLLFALRGQFWRLRQSSEARLYLGLALVAGLTVTAVLAAKAGAYDGRFHDLVRDSFFNTVSVMTSTGYATGFDVYPDGWGAWPHATQLILLGLMIGGGCAGSTAGGIKLIRFIVAGKAVRRELHRYVEPSRIIPVSLQGHPISDKLVLQVGSFLFIYFVSFLIGAVLLAILGHDMITAVTTTISCLSNIGPALGEVGPADNFRHFGPVSQIICIFLMLLGRLEFLGVLMLLRPREWRR